MKTINYLIIVILLLSASCATSNKRLKLSKDEVPQTTVKTTLMPAGPVGKAGNIKEVEEKLVPNDEKAPDPYRYFVIIGSFRDPVNAKEHQAIVLEDGFKSVVLKNEAGLYRVSVLATDDITEARNEVRRIWAKFPEYSDTWMLIRIE